MPTAISTIPTAWTAIQTGPIESIAIQPLSGRIIYTLASSLPAASDEGHSLTAPSGHTISLTASENLYARSQSANSVKLAVTT